MSNLNKKQKKVKSEIEHLRDKYLDENFFVCNNKLVEYEEEGEEEDESNSQASTIKNDIEEIIISDDEDTNDDQWTLVPATRNINQVILLLHHKYQ